MLFPEFASSGNLIGIAKLAPKAITSTSKRRVEYRDIETRRFIGRASGRKMPFDWTINPYRGCEFGCKYCYARFTHEFMELRETEQFEREIYAKAIQHRVVSPRAHNGSPVAKVSAWVRQPTLINPPSDDSK